MVSSIIGRALVGDEFKQTRVWIDEQLTLYVNYVGACERIFKTAIPVAFTVRGTPHLLHGQTTINCKQRITRTAPSRRRMAT